MPILKKLEVKNFESHESTTLNFHPKINVITGETDAGKSSLKRSLEWIARNSPAGDRIRRHNTKKTQVNLDSVAKIRTATKHRYEVGGGVYKALRAQVPAPVREALNLSDVNFQGQHKPYFLINDSPGKVAKAFNKVADLTLIDDVLGECKKRIRENKIHGVYLRKLKKDKREERKKVEWAMEANKILISVENLNAKVSTLRSEIEVLEEIIDLSLQRTEEFNEIPSVIKNQAEVEQSIVDINEDSITELFEIVNIVNECEIEVLKIPPSEKDSQEIENCVSNLSGIEINGLGNLILELSTAKLCVESGMETQQALQNIEEYEQAESVKKELDSQYLNLSVGLTTIDSAMNNLFSSHTDFEVEKNRFDNKMKELGICPLCGSVIK